MVSDGYLHWIVQNYMYMYNETQYSTPTSWRWQFYTEHADLIDDTFEKMYKLKSEKQGGNCRHVALVGYIMSNV